MKKIIILVIVFFALTIVSIYITIPPQLHISRVITVNSSADGINRFLLSGQKNWKQLWPFNDNNPSTELLIYKGDTFQITKRLTNSLEILVHHKTLLFPTTLTVLPTSTETSSIEWRGIISSGSSPIERVTHFRNGIHLKKMMNEVLRSMKNFLEKNENIYGLTIQKISTKDTFLVATKSMYRQYPQTSEIYKQIGNLQQYINLQNAVQTGHPMMNVTQLGNSAYELMVAIPTNRELPESKDFFFRRMVPGNFMSTDVKGGDSTIKKAINALKLYMEDYKKTILAIPFQLLLTDRNAETDTSRWLTRIYFPSM
jgi:hypothetical protein